MNDRFFVREGTAGSQKRARLLRRAAAGSSLKALLAAAVAVAATISDCDTREVLQSLESWQVNRQARQVNRQVRKVVDTYGKARGRESKQARRVR